MNTKGRFGKFGGQYVPEIVMPALNELEAAYAKYKDDPDFQDEFKMYLREYAGRPTNLYYADKLTKYYGRAKIFLKREDLLHTAPTRSTMLSGRHCSRSAWARSALSQRRGPVSTVSLRRRSQRSSAWSAMSSWGHSMSSVRSSMFSA